MDVHVHDTVHYMYNHVCIIIQYACTDSRRQSDVLHIKFSQMLTRVKADPEQMPREKVECLICTCIFSAALPTLTV